MTSADYDSIIRWSTDSIDIRHFSYLGSLRAREGRDESSVSMDIDDGPATEISSLIWRVAYRRAKGLPIDDLELPDLSGFFGGDEEAEPESEASIAAPDEIRNLMQEGESLSSAKRRLTELLWVEQAELRNLRGTDRENLKREAEIERLLGLFARLGEI